jgi:hypothetical protein
MSGRTTDPGDRSSAEIEREVEGTRARLTDTLDELRERVSPGQLMDQVVDYIRGSGGADFAQNLGQAVRDNPLPVLLIGAGVTWLMVSGKRTTTAAGATEPRPAVRSVTGDYDEKVPSGGARTPVDEDVGGHRPALADRAVAAASAAREQAGAAAENLRTTASDIADRATEAIGSAYGSVADAAASVAGKVSATTSTARQRATELGHDARDRAAEAGASAQQGLGWLLQEQPLVLGALGVALGAAVGALLPSTRAENRLMGETRDALGQQVQGAVQEGYERVRDAAGDHLEHARAAAAETYDRAKEHLDQAGLSTAKLGEVVSEVAKDVRQTVRDVTQDIAGEARDTIGPDERD